MEESYDFFINSKRCLKEGGFELRKWLSNSRELNDLMGVTIKDDPYIRKVLGITWDAERDDFLFSFEEIANDANDLPPTKRSILSIGARIYDPLGFLCPVFIQNKVLFQLTCLRKLNWDDNLPDDVKHKWFKWLNDLRLLNHVTIPRFIGANFTDKCNDICLHGFCDSSTNSKRLHGKGSRVLGTHVDGLVCSERGWLE